MTTYYVNGVKTPKDKLGEIEIKSELVKKIILQSLRKGTDNAGSDNTKMLGNG